MEGKPNIWKALILFLLGGALLALDGYVWKQIFVDGTGSGPVSYVLPIVVMICFAAVFSVSAVLVQQKAIAALFVLAASAGSVLFIPLWLGSYVAAALLFLVLLYAFYQISGAYKNSVTFHASSVMKSGFSSLFTALAILMSFYYLQGQLLRPSSIIPQGVVDSAVSLATRLVGQQLEGQLTGPGGEESQGLPPELLQLLPPQFSDILSGTEGSSGSQVLDVSGAAEGAAATIKDQIDLAIAPYKPFIPYVFTVFFFLGVKGITFFLHWFVAPLASLLLQFLIVLGIVRKEKVQIEVERLIL